MRLDRKSVVISRRGVVPGSSDNSFLYHRISGNAYGMQMPPTGPLRAEQIQTIKTWIDQGADWPDSLANEADLPPLNPKAVALVEALRTGDLPQFMKSVAEDPKLLNARGPEGSTPFMYAVLYTGVPTLEPLLKQGADVNKRNDANATALMWGASDLEKTRVLVAHGADVNARSSDMRTPLMIAARCPGNTAAVKFLLDHGANPNPNAHPFTESSPLIEAATAGDAASVELLLSYGAEVKNTAGEPALEMAIAVRCSKCTALLVTKGLSREDYSVALPNIAAFGDVNAVRLMLDHGANVNAVDPLGRTALMYAAASDLIPLDEVKLLVERGADVNAKDAHKQGGDSGLTVLDIARLHGETPVVEQLVKYGAKGTAPVRPLSNHGAKTPSKAPSRKSSLDSAGRCEFRSEGSLRFVSQQQLRGHGGWSGTEKRIPGGGKNRCTAGKGKRVRSGKAARLPAPGFLHSGRGYIRPVRCEQHPDRARRGALQTRSQHRRRCHVPEIASISRWPVGVPGRGCAAADLFGLYRADNAFHARAPALRAKGGQSCLRPGDSTRRGVDGESAIDEQRRS
jgi:ankyrin repeat protein